MRSRLTYRGQQFDLDRISGRPANRVVTISFDGLNFEPPNGWDHPGADIRLEWMPDKCTWEIVNRNQNEPIRINQNRIFFGERRLLTHSRCSIGFGVHEMVFERTPEPPMCNGAPGTLARIGKAGLSIGRQAEAYDPKSGAGRIDLDPEIRTISSKQIEVSVNRGEYRVRSQRGKDRLNGFEGWEDRPLVFGDSIQVGGYEYYTFQFNGNALVHLGAAGLLQARQLCRLVKGRRILASVDVDLAGGEFVGLLGGSGQGKSTLLNALCGISPASSGQVLLDGVVLKNANQMASVGIGYVPQDDIVHRELTVWQALVFATRLRLALSRRQIEAVVSSVLETLHLTEHAMKPVSVLSGGQRKRVSIASELITNPRFLFLDEPTSGLDPMTEQDLMAELAQIAKNKRVGVLCTTHMLQNSHLFSSIAIIHGGRIIFKGKAVDAVRFFQGSADRTVDQSAVMQGESADARGFRPDELIDAHEEIRVVTHLPKVYRRIGDMAKERADQIEQELRAQPNAAKESPAEMVAREFEQDYKLSPLFQAPLPVVRLDKPAAAIGRPPSTFSVWWTLLMRQWKLLVSDPLNYLFLLAQAMVIGFLVGWVSDNLVLQMFLGVIATLWFGCSNGAQQIVGELPIFCRERLAGVGMNAYLLSKYTFQSAVTFSQALLLFFTLLTTHHCFHREVPTTVDRYDPVLDQNMFADKFFEDPVLVQSEADARLAEAQGSAAKPEGAGPRELKSDGQIGWSGGAATQLFESKDEAQKRSDLLTRWNGVRRSSSVRPEERKAVMKEMERLPGAVRSLLETEDLMFQVAGIAKVTLKDGAIVDGVILGEGEKDILIGMQDGSETNYRLSDVANLERGKWKIQVKTWNKQGLDDLFVMDASGGNSAPVAKAAASTAGLPTMANPTGLLPLSREFEIFSRIAWYFRIRENVVNELGARRIPASEVASFKYQERSWLQFTLFLLGLRLGALFAASLCGVALGLFVSASVRSSTQAVMWVPLIMIPQILFGGYVVTAPEMNRSVRGFSSWLPSYNLQNLMDVANLYGRRVPRITNKTKIPNFLAVDPFDQEKVVWSKDGQRSEEHYELLSGVGTSWQNLNVDRSKVGQRAKELGDVKAREAQPDFVSRRDDIYFGEGATFRVTFSAVVSSIFLGCWVVASYIGTLWNLARRAVGR